MDETTHEQGDVLTANAVLAVLEKELVRIAAELEASIGAGFEVTSLGPSAGKFGMDDAIGVSIAEHGGSRRLALWPQDNWLTWFEFLDGERYTVSDNRTDFTASADPNYLRRETEVVAQLMMGNYRVVRRGILMRKLLVVPTSGRTWYIDCLW